MNLKVRSPIDILSSEISDSILEKTIQDLQLEAAIEGTHTDPAFKRLCNYYAKPKAWRLYGFLMSLETYGEHFYRMTWLNVSKQTYFRYLNECRKAEVWTTG